jgi:hypothetical protein
LNLPGDSSVYRTVCWIFAMAEVGLQRPRIVALVGQREAAGVPQHVRMSLEA